MMWLDKLLAAKKTGREETWKGWGVREPTFFNLRINAKNNENNSV